MRWIALTGWIAGLLLAAMPVLPAQAGAAPRSATSAAMRELSAEHQRVLDALNAKDAEGHSRALDDPGVRELLDQGWGLAGAWAAAYLDAHPMPSRRDLQRIFAGFAPKPRGIKSPYGNFLEYPDYSFEGAALRLGAATYVVEARYFSDSATGSFFVVARNRQGHFQALWNIKDLAEKHYALRDEIGRWAYLTRRAYYNGPLLVSRLLRLSPAANGDARFLVDAYQSADGGTALGQLSIWEWDGREARPLLIEIYRYAIGFGDFRFDGRTLRLATKEELETVFSCGQCPDPRGIWTVRITPGGVRNLGHRLLQPEIQWADELLAKIGKGEDATDLAAPKVIAALKEASDEPNFSWGMLGRCRILRRGRRGAFELVLDEGRLRFSYVVRKGRHYFTDVRIKA